MSKKLNPKDIQYLDPYLISFITLKDGTIIYPDESIPPEFSSNMKSPNSKNCPIEPNQTLTNMDTLLENEKNQIFSNNKKTNLVKSYTDKNISKDNDKNNKENTNSNKNNISKNSKNKIIYSSSLLENKENQENNINDKNSNNNIIKNNNIESIKIDPIALRRQRRLTYNNNNNNQDNLYNISSSPRDIKTINPEISINIKGKNEKKRKNDILEQFNHLLKGINEKKRKKNSETFYITKYRNYKLNNSNRNSFSSSNMFLIHNSKDKPIQYMNDNDAKFSNYHHIKDNSSNGFFNSISNNNEKRVKKNNIFRNIMNNNRGDQEERLEKEKIKRNSTFSSIFRQNNRSKTNNNRVVSPANKISGYKIK